MWLHCWAIPFASFQNFAMFTNRFSSQDGGNEFRLIHYLSYPDGFSMNDHIPYYLCSVSYTTIIDDAVGLIKKLGPSCLLAKTEHLHLEYYLYILLMMNYWV
jgi:hypothetical protein